MSMQAKEVGGAIKRRSIAYIIGPYRDDRGASFIDANIQRARTVAKALWAKGYTVICPHSNSAFFDGCTKDSDFLEGYLQLLIFVDVAFIVPEMAGLVEVSVSKGCNAEIDFCLLHNIPIMLTALDEVHQLLIPDEWRYTDEQRKKF